MTRTNPLPHRSASSEDLIDQLVEDAVIDALFEGDTLARRAVPWASTKKYGLDVEVVKTAGGRGAR